MRRKNTTTEFLKECIADALLKLLQKKSIDKITVSEITELAGVGRVTFYRNFNTKEEVLEFKFNLLGEQWFEALTEEQLSDGEFMVNSFFHFIYEIRDTILILHHSGHIYIVLSSFYKAFKKVPTSNHTEELKNCYHACGLFGIVMEWINNDFKETPSELSNLVLEQLV